MVLHCFEILLLLSSCALFLYSIVFIFKSFSGHLKASYWLGVVFHVIAALLYVLLLLIDEYNKTNTVNNVYEQYAIMNSQYNQVFWVSLLCIGLFPIALILSLKRNRILITSMNLIACFIGYYFELYIQTKREYLLSTYSSYGIEFILIYIIVYVLFLGLMGWIIQKAKKPKI